MYRIIFFTLALLSSSVHFVCAQLVETPFDKVREKVRVYRAAAKVSRQYICLELPVISPDGNRTTKLDTAEIVDFDRNGRVTKITRFHSEGYRRILYKYDALGRRIWNAIYEGDSNFPLGGAVTIWTYDQDNYKVMQKDGMYSHVVLKKLPNEDRYLENGKLAGLTRYSYNAVTLTHSEVTLELSGKAKSRYQTVVDSLGRPVERRSLNDNLSVGSLNRYTYDKNDNVIEDVYILQSDKSGNKYVSRYNNQNLIVELEMQLLDGRVLNKQFYFYEHYE